MNVRVRAAWACAMWALMAMGGCSGLSRDIVVEKKPDNATVFVNNKEVTSFPVRMTWPDDKTDVLIKVQAKDYETVTQSVTLAQARATKGPIAIAVDLPPLRMTAPLQVQCNVEGYMLRIDGETLPGYSGQRLALLFERATSKDAWKPHLIEVGKERYQAVMPDGSFRPIYSASIGPNALVNGPLSIKLEAVKYFETQLKRFVVGPQGVSVATERVISQVTDLEVEPKVTGVTKMTDFPPGHGLYETRLSVMPDNEQIVFSLPVFEAEKKEPQGANLWVARRGSVGRLTDAPSFDLEPAVSPDGLTVYFASNRLGRLTIRSLASTGKGGIGVITDSQSSLVDTDPTLSGPGPGGSRLAFTRLGSGGDVPELWTSKADGSDPRQHLLGRQPAWSPDGTNLAFVAKDKVTGFDNIWVMNWDGTDPYIKTENDSNYRYPAWTPDGQCLVYSSDKGVTSEGKHNYDIWMRRLDGFGPQIQLTTNGSFDSRPAVSPNGKYVYFLSNRGAKKDGEETLQVWRLEFADPLTIVK